MKSRRDLLAYSAFWLATISPAIVCAQTNAPGRIVVGFAPGGSVDSVARLIATHLQKAGAPFIVDNKPGAAGRLAVGEVKNAPADGRTVLFTPDPMMTVYPLVYRKLAYDPVADFKPVTPIASVPMGIAVGPMVPEKVQTLADLAAWLKANPEKASFGTAGAGSTLHFIGVTFGKANGFDFRHVPYRGGAPAVVDLVGGQIPVSINVISELIPLVQTGKLRVLAVSSSDRSRFLPNVPTFREAGYKNLESMSWFGAFLPARTPNTAVEKIHAALTSAASSAEVREGLEKLGYEVFTQSPDRFSALIKADLERWIPMVKASGYTADE